MTLFVYHCGDGRCEYQIATLNRRNERCGHNLGLGRCMRPLALYGRVISEASLQARAKRDAERRELWKRMIDRRLVERDVLTRQFTDMAERLGRAAGQAAAEWMRDNRERPEWMTRVGIICEAGPDFIMRLACAHRVYVAGHPLTLLPSPGTEVGCLQCQRGDSKP